MDIDGENPSSSDDRTMSLSLTPNAYKITGSGVTHTTPSLPDLSEEENKKRKMALIMQMLKFMENPQPPVPQTVEEQRSTTTGPTTAERVCPPSFDFSYGRVCPPSFDFSYMSLASIDLGTSSTEQYKICQALPKPSLVIEGRAGTNSLVTRHRHRPKRYQTIDIPIARPNWIEERMLLAAIKQADMDTVYQLVRTGIDLDTADEKKRTALHLAASQGSFNIVNILLSKNANPNKQDVLGNTPLHLAVCRGDNTMVKLLLEGGADVLMRDSLSRTPLMIVTSRIKAMRKNKRTPWCKLQVEFEMIDRLLTAENKKRRLATSVSSLCTLMRNVTTREQADEVADSLIDKMADLNVAESSPNADKTPQIPGPLSIL